MHTQQRIAVGTVGVVSAVVIMAGGVRAGTQSRAPATSVSVSSNRSNEFVAGVTARAVRMAGEGTWGKLGPGIQGAFAKSRQGDWNTVSTDVTIRRSHVDVNGTVLRTVPSTTYRLEVTDTGLRRKTVMTLTAAERPKVRTTAGVVELTDTFGVMRIEDDGDGSPLRLFDGHGKQIVLPAEKSPRLQELAGMVSQVTRPALGDPADFERARAASSVRDVADGITADPAARAERRTEIERRYGAARGQVKGLDRFVSTVGPRTLEMLVDPEVVLPAAVNVMENGALIGHTTFTYRAGPANRLIRHTIHTENLVPTARGGRALADIEFANVRLERRAVR